MTRFSTADNLVKRSITGISLAATVLIMVGWNACSFAFLICTINVLSLREFYGLYQSGELLPRAAAGIILSLVMIGSILTVAARILSAEILLINIPVAYGVLISELYSRSRFPFHNLAFTFSGIMYITVPLLFFIGIAFFPLGLGTYYSAAILGYFFTLWGSDTGAYLIGKRFGAHPLFKRISPNKTLEGSIGGGLCALAIAGLNSAVFKNLSVEAWIMIAIIIVLAGTFGDLIKSMMKRSLKIKDSGTILPGHGGMLDRFDSLFGSTPIAFCYLVVFYRHV